jgi:hypothetical protein
MSDDANRISEDVADALRRARADELDRARRSPAARANRWVVFDPRPTTPSQLMVLGGALLAAQMLRVYALLGLGALGSTLGTAGLLILLVGVVTWLMRPPRRQMYWRGRRLEVDPSPAWQHRLYRALYRDS